MVCSYYSGKTFFGAALSRVNFLVLASWQSVGVGALKTTSAVEEVLFEMVNDNYGNLCP